MLDDQARDPYIKEKAAVILQAEGWAKHGTIGLGTGSVVLSP